MGNPSVTQCNVALDLHGLVLDHRRAKFEYFRDVLRTPYSDERLSRAEILAELAAQGLTQDYYFTALDSFFRTSFVKPALPGVSQFLQAVPQTWTTWFVTTSRYNTIDSVRIALKDAGLPTCGPILVSSDEIRIGALVKEGVVAYFDDKPNLFASAIAAGLFTVQVNSSRYKNRSPIVNLFYEDWHQVLASLPVLVAAINKQHELRGS